jgi:hypothetical protein
LAQRIRTSGPLVAYRFGFKSELTPSHLVSATDREGAAAACCIVLCRR